MAVVPDGEMAEPPLLPDEDAGVGGGEHFAVCPAKGAADAVAGGLMGSVFGFGAGLFKKQGFKGSIREAGSSAKTFALLSGVHSLVSCYMRRIRGKEDAWNAGIAGCATGLALNTPGTPEALAQGCLTFGAFSFLLEYMNRPRAAIAATSSKSKLRQSYQHMDLQLCSHVLPPFTLPPLMFISPHQQSQPSLLRLIAHHLKQLQHNEAKPL